MYFKLIWNVFFRNDPNFKNIKFNEDDKEVNYNRKSYHGNYKIQYNDVLNADVPLNPIGRTGIIGRGHLGRWGPNHAAGQFYKLK